MALPNREQYIPVKTIYTIQAPLKYDQGGSLVMGWFQHGVTFNEHGRGSTTSFHDKEFLVKNCGCKDITEKHWKQKAKEWDKLVKADAKGKGKPESEPEPEPEEELESEPEVEDETKPKKS